MQSTKRTSWTVVAIVAIIALIAVTACQSPAPTAQTGPVHVVVDNAGDFGGGGGPAGAAGDTNFTNLVASGDVTVGDDLAVTGDTTLTGGLTVTGGVTGTNVLATGNQTIAGIKTFSTAIAVGALTGPVTLTGPTAAATATPAVVVNNLGAANNSFEVRDASTPVFVVGQAGVGNITGAMTMSGGAVVTGPTAAATASPGMYVDNLGAANVSFEVRDAATPVFQVLNGGNVAAGAIYGKAPVLAKDASYAVLTTDTGSIIKASGAITMTLPAAVVGLNYCIVNYTGDDQVIAFADATDVALNEVNSPGDRVTNSTVYDLICLSAIDATNWVTLSSVGTWADGD